MAGTVAAVLVVVVAAALRSAAAALRLVITCALTLSWCYGAGVAVFQVRRSFICLCSCVLFPFSFLRARIDDNASALSDAHRVDAQLSLFHSSSGALADVHDLFWMGPVMSFSLVSRTRRWMCERLMQSNASVCLCPVYWSWVQVVGLAVDYDLLLSSRVREFRAEGYTTRAAIIKARARGACRAAAALVPPLTRASRRCPGPRALRCNCVYRRDHHGRRIRLAHGSVAGRACCVCATSYVWM